MKGFRQNKIIELLQEERMVNTAQLAERFRVSIATIRRDLDAMEQLGLLKKTYGGAERYVPDGECGLEPLHMRKQYLREVKSAIAERASGFITDDCTIALDAGSTILELCKHLCARRNLIVISGDINSAAELLSSGGHRVYMMGGFLTPYGTSSGAFAKEFLNSIATIDFFVFSTDGAMPSDGLTTNEDGINELKKLYLRKANKKIAIVDHSKFQKKGFYKMCDFSDIDVLITDSVTPDDILEKLRKEIPTVEVVSILNTD